MPVELNENENPVAWGKDIDGESIPNPPDELVKDPSKQPKWDAENEAWTEDPDWSPPRHRPEAVDRGKISVETVNKIAEARANDDIQTQIDHLFEIMGIDVDEELTTEQD